MELRYRKYVLFPLLIILMGSIFPMEVPITFGVSKINDDLYEGKAKNKDVYFVMERVTPKNIQFWESFIKSQWSLQKELKTKVSVRATELKDPVLKKIKKLL